MDKVSVIIITRNEEKRINETLLSVKWANEIIIVDSHSKDGTIEIARRYTDKIFQKRFNDFSSQKNFAISKCCNNWILSIDCDEVVSYLLKTSIETAVGSASSHAAYRVKRINSIFGKQLIHAAGDDFPIRLFRKDMAYFIQPIHEILKVEGEIGILKGELFHNTTSDIRSEYEKTERYTELEAQWLLERNIKPTFFKLLFYPACIFLKIAFFKAGILDGREGLLFAFVSARYMYIKYLKAYRLTQDPRFLEGLIASRFDELVRQFPDSIDDNDSRLNRLLEALKNFDGKRIIEIGCGKGRFTNAVTKRNAICVGVDMSEQLLKEACKKNKGIFLKSNATELAFKSRIFDAAFAVEVIEHLPDLEKFLQEAARLLRSDGSLVIIDRNIFSINNRRYFIPNIIIKRYHEIKNDWMYPRGFAYTERWFIKGDIERILKRYFTDVSSSYIISDAEKASKTAFMFQKVPLSRHFILWKATKPKNV